MIWWLFLLLLSLAHGAHDDPLLLGFHVGSGLPLPKTFSLLSAHRDSPAERYIQQAELLARTGRLEDAAATYESTLSTYTMGSEAEASVHLALGTLYGQLSATEEAEQSFRAAVDCARLAHVAHWALSSLYAREGRFAEAAQELEVSLALRPGWFAALHDLGSILIIQGQIDAGLAHFQRAVSSLEDSGLDLASVWERTLAAVYSSPRVSPSLLERHLIDHILQVFRLPGKNGREWRSSSIGSGSGSGSSSSSEAASLAEDATTANSEFTAVGASLWGFLQKLQTIDIAQFHRGMGLKLQEAGAFEDGTRHLLQALALSPSRTGNLAIFTTLALPLVYASTAEVWAVRRRMVQSVREALQDRGSVIHPELLNDLYMLQFQLPYSGLPAHLLMRDIARWLSSCENPTLNTVSPRLTPAYPAALAAATGHSGFLELAPPHTPVQAQAQAQAAAAAAAAAADGVDGVVGSEGGGLPVGSGPRRTASAREGSGSSSSSSSGSGREEEQQSEESEVGGAAAAAAESAEAGSPQASTPAAPPASVWNPFILPRSPGAHAPPPPTVRVGIITYQTFDCATGHLLHTLARHLKGFSAAVKQRGGQAKSSSTASGRALAGALKATTVSEGPSYGAGALPRWLLNASATLAGSGSESGSESGSGSGSTVGSWEEPFQPWAAPSACKSSSSSTSISNSSSSSSSAPPLLDALRASLLTTTPSGATYHLPPRGGPPLVAGFHTTLFQMSNMQDSLTRLLLSQVDSVVNIPKLQRELAAKEAAAAAAAAATGSSAASATATASAAAASGTVFDLATLRAAITSASLDILLVADPGISASLYTLLFARTAPVQVALWGSETAGLLTLGLPNSCDYYVTGDEATPPAAQAELLEQSVRLGGLGLYLPRMRPRSAREVADAVAQHGVLAGSHLFLVPAPINALHPAFDAVLLGILAADPAAVLILLCERGQELWVSKLRRRLAAHPLVTGEEEQQQEGSCSRETRAGAGAGAGAGADPNPSPSAPRTRLLSRLSFYEESAATIGASSSPHQRALLSAADAVLDTFPVGLGMPALEALGEGTPCITMPSAQPMRSVAGGAAAALGLCTPAALLCVGSVSEYVARAVEFAVNASKRGVVRRALKARGGGLQWESWDRWTGGGGKGGGVCAASSNSSSSSSRGGNGGGEEEGLEEGQETAQWELQRQAQGRGDPATGTLTDWLTFLGRVGRPWAASREAGVRDREGHGAGAVAGGGARRSGLERARKSRERKERRARRGGGGG